MDKASPFTAETMRKQLRAIPKDRLDANQPFSIRIWRGLSWLERAEQATDADEQFIALWIAFNAIYGRAGGDGDGPGVDRRPGDRATWQAFLAEIIKRDGTDILGDLVRRNHMPILRMIQNKYLFQPFWDRRPSAEFMLKNCCTAAVLNFANHLTTGIVEELFERLYVLRAQVFHGAATRGSKLNRANLRNGADLLSKLLAAMIAIMLAAGPDVDWGEVCFPPIKN
jgi:hypothetical protein